MSQFSTLLSQFQSVPQMSTGLSRRVARHGAARHQSALNTFNESVSAVQTNNTQVMGDMLSLGGEASMSVLGSLGEFAKSALSDLFGANAGSAAEAGPASDSSPSLHEASTPLQSRMGMGESLLRRGSSGPEVRTLQKNLRDRGFDIEIDGKFGPETEKALRDFQGGQKIDDQAIGVDGILGPETSQALSNTKTESTDDVSGAGDGAKAENMAADRAGELNGAGDGAKAENAAAANESRDADRSGAGDGAAAQSGASDKGGSGGESDSKGGGGGK